MRVQYELLLIHLHMIHLHIYIYIFKYIVLGLWEAYSYPLLRPFLKAGFIGVLILKGISEKQGLTFLLSGCGCLIDFGDRTRAPSKPDAPESHGSLSH